MYFRFLSRICFNKRLSSRFTSSDVRVRFAPSPTGQLHIGGYRTALYNYLFAKQNNGQFILRLEDTDQERLVPGAAELMEESLEWGHIIPDESPLKGGQFGPYTQSQRLELYQKCVDILLESGQAYRCFCSERRLELLRREAARNRQMNRYDGRCRHLTKEQIEQKLAENQSFTIRFAMNLDEIVSFEDMIYGPSEQIIQEGDPIIVKTDGFPTYHLANVIDDHYMKISHVFRGYEWHVSTSKHLLLYKAFNWTPPKFGHLPLIINPDGSKLSKRQGDIHVEHYKDQGFYSETITNFAITSGGGFNHEINEDDIREMNELIKSFDISKIKQSFSGLNFDKMGLFNKQVIMKKIESNTESLIEESHKHLKSVLGNVPVSDETLLKCFQLDRIERISDLTTNPDLKFLWHRPENAETLAKAANLSDIQNVISIIEENDEFSQANSAIRKYAKKNKLQYPTLMKHIRLFLAGTIEGIPVKDQFDLLGKNEAMERIRIGFENLSNKMS